MHGSFIETFEKISVKKKDSSKNKIKKADQEWHKKRQNRHNHD
jgi:hypothetical protein